MTSEERVRVQLRARAWDVAAALPEALELPGPVEEAVAHGGYEIVVTIRRCGGPPPPDALLTLEPLRRFLPGCWLTDLERAVVAELLAGGGRRRTQAQLRGPAEERLRRRVGEGPLKAALARLCDAGVGVLDNDRAAAPPGYRVTDDYRAFLAWAERARRGRGVLVA